MNTDTIYKNIGYVVVLLFGFYIASKSLLFQTKIIEGLTAREKKKQQKEESAARRNQEQEYSEHLNEFVILKTHKLNNPNLKNMKKFRGKYMQYIEEYNKLVNNFILHEKISIGDFLLNKYDELDYSNKQADGSYNSAMNINFNNIINTLIKKTQNIEILEKCIIYLDETTGGDLEEDIEDEEDNDTDVTDDSISKKEEDIKETNKTYEENNNIDIEFMSSVQSELKNSLLELLTSYKTEYKIYMIDSLLNIYNNQNDGINDDKVNTISYNNKVVNTLEKTETILSEIFSGGVSSSSVSGKKNKRNKKKKGVF